MSSLQQAAMDGVVDDRDALSVAKHLRFVIDSKRICCLYKLQEVWLDKWGDPSHTLSVADLLCCRSFKSEPDLHRRPHYPSGNPELKPFFPLPQELSMDPSNLPRRADWGSLLLKAAKARRKACFENYGRTQPPAIPDVVIRSSDAALPQDVLIFSMVLPHLPLPDVFRARAVCRLWHQMLSSPLHFRCLAANPDFDRPRLVVQTSTPTHSSCLAIFDKDHWSQNPIPLPPFCLRAAAAGLLCFCLETAEGLWEDNILLVGNPLSQQWRQLPPIPLVTNRYSMYSKGLACTMWADPLRGHYKVFVLGTPLCIYDSLSDAWEEIRVRLPSVTPSQHRRMECSITPFGLLHQLSPNGQDVFSYDVGDKSTSYVETYGPSRMDMFQLKQPFSRLPALAYCSGRVFVVARLKAETPILGSRLPWVIHGLVAVWVLQQTSAFGDMGKWGWPISVAPQDLLEGAIAGSDGTDFCVTTDGDKTIYLVLSGGATMLAYDVESGVWSALPGCPPAFLISFPPQPYYVPLLWLGSV